MVLLFSCFEGVTSHDLYYGDSVILDPYGRNGNQELFRMISK
jgi:hypothetical protein